MADGILALTCIGFEFPTKAKSTAAYNAVDALATEHEALVSAYNTLVNGDRWVLAVVYDLAGGFKAETLTDKQMLYRIEKTCKRTGGTEITIPADAAVPMMLRAAQAREEGLHGRIHYEEGKRL